MISKQIDRLTKWHQMVIGIFGMVLCFVFVPMAQAQCTPTDSQQIIPAGLDAFDNFGNRVAVSGEWAVVASQLDDDVALNCGAAYMFHFDGNSWVQAAKLLPHDGAADDYFGYDVAISGNTVVVGSWKNSDPGPPSSYGAAYVYVNDGGSWVFQAKLRAGGAYGTEFGTSVAIDGDQILVGANQHYSTIGRRGVAYLYKRTGSTWGDFIAFEPTTGGTQVYNFGCDVALKGNTAIIGAYSDREMGMNSGSVFVFNTSTLQQVQKIYAPNPATYDDFGRAVSFDGTTLIASGRDNGGTYGGAVYTYEYSGVEWVNVQTLKEFQGSGGNLFGYWRAEVSGDYILSYEGGYKRVYLFHHDGSTWVDEGQLIPLDAANCRSLGSGLGLDGSTVLIGDQLHEVEGVRVGAVHVFDPGCESLTPVGEFVASSTLVMKQSYPNPFNPSTNIQFHLGESSEVELSIYNISGQLVTTLLSRYMEQGNHSVLWNGQDNTQRSVPSGVYYALVTTGTETQSTKLVLIK